MDSSCAMVVMSSVRELKQFAVAHLSRFVDRFTLFLAALSLLGASSTLLREVPYGVSLGPDGVIYISVARNLLVGEGFVNWTGGHYVSWAPLWPALLAFASIPGLDPYGVAGLANAGALGLVIFISGSWLRKHIESRFLVVWACLAVVVPVFVTEIAVTPLSDTSFVLFVLLSLIGIEKFLNEGRTALLVWAAVWAALACLTRYPGVTVILAAVLLLVLDRNAALVERVKRVAVYTLISAAPLCLWMLRNLLLTGDPAGPRNTSSIVSFQESVRLTVDGVGRWVFLPLYSKRLTGWAEQVHLDSLLAAIQASATPVTVVVLLMLAVVVVHSLLRLHQHTDDRAKVDPLAVFGTFALTYLAFLTVVKSLTYVDNGARHYLPAYMPLLFIATLGMDRLLRCGRDGRLLRMNGWLSIRTVVRKWHLAIVMGVVLSLWLAYHSVYNARHAQHLVTKGSGYQSRRYIDSETLRYLQAQRLSGRMYSQSGHLMYWHLKGKHWDRSSVDVQPDLGLRSFTRHSRDLSQWLEDERAAAGATYVVWFKELGGFGDYDIDVLMALPNLELVTELSDGYILRVRK